MITIKKNIFKPLIKLKNEKKPIKFNGKILRNLEEDQDFTLGKFKKRYYHKIKSGK